MRSGLVVRRLAVHPSELHQTASTAYERMLQGLRCLAEAIDVTLDLQTLQNQQPIEEFRSKLRSGMMDA